MERGVVGHNLKVKYTWVVEVVTPFGTTLFNVLSYADARDNQLGGDNVTVRYGVCRELLDPNGVVVDQTFAFHDRECILPRDFSYPDGTKGIRVPTKYFAEIRKWMDERPDLEDENEG